MGISVTGVAASFLSWLMLMGSTIYGPGPTHGFCAAECGSNNVWSAEYENHSLFFEVATNMLDPPHISTQMCCH